MDKFDYCMAEINHRIFEAGLFLPDEKVVLTLQGFVLLEHFTGKKYDYRMVDLATRKARKLGITLIQPINCSG